MKPEVLSKHEGRFLDWLGSRHPELKAHVLSQQGQLSGIGGSLSATLNSLLTGASNAVNQYVKGKQQVDLVKINWERAKKGLPIFATVEQAQAALNPQPAPKGFAATGASLLKSPVFWIVVGIGAVLLLRSRSR